MGAVPAAAWPGWARLIATRGCGAVAANSVEEPTSRIPTTAKPSTPNNATGHHQDKSFCTHAQPLSLLWEPPAAPPAAYAHNPRFGKPPAPTHNYRYGLYKQKAGGRRSPPSSGGCRPPLLPWGACRAG